MIPLHAAALALRWRVLASVIGVQRAAPSVRRSCMAQSCGVACHDPPDSENAPDIADDIESEFPEHAAYLRTFHVGQSGKRTENGHTAHNIELAKIWCQIDDRIKRGEAEGDVLADWLKSPASHTILSATCGHSTAAQPCARSSKTRILGGFEKIDLLMR